MRVKFWTGAQVEDGSVWYRCTTVSQALAWNGWQAESSNMLTPVDQHSADVIVGSRVGNPGPSEMWQRLCAERRAFMVLDLDDDYLNLDPENEPAYSFWSDKATRDRLIANIKAAHRVICVSEKLAEVIWEYNRNIYVIPNSLHAAYLQPARDYYPDNRPLVIGWAGSSSTAPYLSMVAPALNRIQEIFDGLVQVKLIGVSPERVAKAGIRGDHVTGEEWVTPNSAYLKATSEFDIWVAPYANTHFNRCKFPTKALEAGFHGIPLIASDILPYRSAIVNGQTGFLATEIWEWREKLSRLISSPELRRDLGNNARSRVTRGILQSVVRVWERALTPPESMDWS